MSERERALEDAAWIGQWLTECARYFRKRNTGGEDMAHWANVYNAENCEKILANLQLKQRALIESTSQVAKLEEAVAFTDRTNAALQDQITGESTLRAQVAKLEEENADILKQLDSVTGNLETASERIEKLEGALGALLEYIRRHFGAPVMPEAKAVIEGAINSLTETAGTETAQ